ncbi:alpha-amylase family protein [Paenibacillus glycinis]|uniref:Alpha-galactosidase n=1 Tax=Paenibacillus glycinis TaxID=2697035 RepID=A0ABW9XIP8_9BACL|nr:alpha-galactosidase [Paenibacillus glycinis]NBD22349.1 alpha-galactosidase [Paenibacillus glycinis]
MTIEQSQWRTTSDGALLKVDNGLMELQVDLAAGTYDLVWRDGSALTGVSAAYRFGDDVLRTSDYGIHTAGGDAIQEVNDGAVRGIRLTVRHEAPELPLLKQHFTLYEERPSIVVGFELEAQAGGMLESNYLAPVLAASALGALRLGSGDGERAGDGNEAATALLALRVPFDNDKWVRYETTAMPGALESYEATAVYEPVSRRGMVMGSVRHDTWKTGLKLASGSGAHVEAVEAYGGAAGELTRDSIAHGAVTGATIASPDIWIGVYGDYRRGLEAFGQANAATVPALAWEQGVPFGWNSWSAAANKLDYDLYVKTSDFLRGMQDRGFHNNGDVYINFDSFWTNLTPEQLRQSVAHVNRNGQKAGIYWTPFAFWGKDASRKVEGTDGRYAYDELLLRDREGNVLPELDGGLAIDPTHPGNLLRTEYHLNRFVDWGFDYVKLDFLGHGALEGKHHDPSVHTGMQAYNLGMDCVRKLLAPERIGRPFHVNLSIAPLFPYQYGHSRRISCDAFGTLSDTEYMLNSLGGAWWANDAIYRFNDPDHTVLYKSYNQDATSYHEGRSRLNASVVSGTVLLLGDDFRKEEARERASEWLPNDKVMALARRGQTFVPVEGIPGAGSTDAFVLESHGEGMYLAVFNFDPVSPAVKSVPAERLAAGRGSSRYRLEDLWSGAATEGAGTIELPLAAGESALLKLTWLA